MTPGAPGNEFRPDDYVNLGTVKSRIMGIGVPDASVDSHIQTLIRFGLLQADTLTLLDDPDFRNTEFENITAVHITAAGQYYLDTLRGTFQYLQRVTPDVPVMDQATAEKMAEAFAPFKAKPFVMPVDQGVQVVKMLVEYLSSQEESEHEQGLMSRDPILSTVRFVDSMKTQIVPELKAIENWAKKKEAEPNKAMDSDKE